MYVYQPLDAGGGEAVVRHMLHIISGQVAVWRQGKRMMLPACSEEQHVEFPRFGHTRVWNMGHSEPETIPRFILGIEEVNFFMGFGRGSGLFIRPVRLGLFANTRISDTIARDVSLVERPPVGSQAQEPSASTCGVKWMEKKSITWRVGSDRCAKPPGFPYPSVHRCSPVESC